MTTSDEIKSTGLKATLPRLKILEIFQQGKQRHMTAEDVFRVLLEHESDVGLATIYRVLAQFERADILVRSLLRARKRFMNSMRGSITIIWCASIVAKWKSFTTPKLKNVNTQWPRPRALPSPTTP